MDKRTMRFVGGTNDGAVHRVEHGRKHHTVPIKENYADCYDVQSPGEFAERQKYKIETYTLRTVHFENGKLSYFAHADLDDFNAFRELLIGHNPTSA